LIAAVDAAARAAGLAQGMALTQARILVPDLEVRFADLDGDAAFLTRLALHAARHWTPRAAVSGADGLWLDLSGAAHLFGGEEAMCRRILGFCARLGLEARLAVAGSFGAAHALARFPARPIVLLPPGGEAEALAPLPPAALRLDEGTLATARRLGIATIGELIAMPRAPLQRRFGGQMLMRLDQALGRAGEPIDPVDPEDPPAAELRFMEPIVTAEAIAEALSEGARRLARILEKSGLAARLVLWRCERVDGAVQAVRIGTARATRDPVHLLRLLARRIEEIEPGFGIERMMLTALRVEPLRAQPVARVLAGEEPASDLVPLVDLLAGRLGPRRLFRLGAVESDVPERSVARLGPLGQPRAWPHWPRPVRLLAPPERVENVVALLPDQPPRRFTWRGRAFQVTRADGPERIHGEWWRRSAEAEAVRDYFQVEAEGGARFWLYRRGDGLDPRTGDLSWYLQGVFG
jgi:protein ImuB